MTISQGKIKEIKVKNISFLNWDLGKSAEQEHNRIIGIIVDALYNRGYRKINYDHIKEIYPRENIPLYGMGRKWDIMIGLGNNKYIAIEVKSLRETEIEEYEDENGGVIYTCLNCGWYLWSNNEEEIKQFDELLKNNTLECINCKGRMFNRREKDGNNEI